VLASRYQPVESLEMRRRCFGRTAGLDVGVLGGVGVVNVFGVGEKEDCEGLCCECGLLGFLSVMVRVAAGRPVRMRDVVFIFGGWVASSLVGWFVWIWVSTRLTNSRNVGLSAFVFFRTAMSKGGVDLNCRNEESQAPPPFYIYSTWTRQGR
jgi:hypothetical protein